MRSHFLPQKATAMCALAGATTLLAGSASAQIAADYATNSIYASGWAAGQNGGSGFGPWSFDSTGLPKTGSGPQQEMTGGAPIGTSWTLFNLGSAPGGAGISNVGRAIPEPGGLQPGQTFETVIDNPTAYHYYGGFDILFLNGTDNNPGGDNASALRLTVFGYGSGEDTAWTVTDGSPYGSTTTPLIFTNTAAAGMKIDFTMVTTNSYSLTMTPLNGTSPYTLTGTLANTSLNNNTSSNVTELPINWVNYRLWNGKSAGSNDLTENFEISSMTIEGLPVNIQTAGTNAVLSWLDIPGYYLESATNLNPPVTWASNSISPTTINGENFVTNPITGRQQYFRLQLQQ
jgi:hypothetical protein